MSQENLKQEGEQFLLGTIHISFLAFASLALPVILVSLEGILPYKAVLALLACALVSIVWFLHRARVAIAGKNMKIVSLEESVSVLENEISELKKKPDAPKLPPYIPVSQRPPGRMML